LTDESIYERKHRRKRTKSRFLESVYINRVPDRKRRRLFQLQRVGNVVDAALRRRRWGVSVFAVLGAIGAAAASDAAARAAVPTAARTERGA